MLADGVPDGHVGGGQVQLVGAGQRVVAGEGVREGRDRLVQQLKDRALHRPPQRLRQGLGFCQDEPGKQTRRSLTYSPCLSERLAGEHGRVIARAGVGLNGRQGDARPLGTGHDNDPCLTRPGELDAPEQVLQRMRAGGRTGQLDHVTGRRRGERDARAVCGEVDRAVVADAQDFRLARD